MKIIFIILIFLTLSKCSSTSIRGDEFREQWMKEYMYNEEVDRKKIRPDERRSFNINVAVLVSEKNLEGEEWNQSKRRQKPNLKLYILKGDYEQNLICEKSQSVTLHCDYPIILSGNDLLNFRLIDRKNSGVKYQYSSKYNRDEEYSEVSEEPLAQLDYIFEGQGKYLKNSGAATFIFTIKELKLK